MRGLVLLALPGIVFGWLTQVPQLRLKSIEFDSFAPDDGWFDVVAAVTFAAVVALVMALVVVVLVKLGIGADRSTGRRTTREIRALGFGGSDGEPGRRRSCAYRVGAATEVATPVSLEPGAAPRSSSLTKR
jgi:hypothetical protein